TLTLPALGDLPLDGGSLTIGPVTLTVAPAHDGPGLAARCSLEGDPLASECRVAEDSIAVDAAGHVYVGDTAGLRRYVVGDGAGAGCALVLDAGFGHAGVVPWPVMEPKGQVLGKGPVYMRSGGPEWKVAIGPRGEAYIYDYLLGIHRVDRGKVEPVCPDLQGIHALRFIGKQAYVGQGALSRLTIGRTCKVTPAKLDQPARFGFAVVGDALVAEVDFHHLARFDGDGKTVATYGIDDAFAPGGYCSAVAQVPCGDGLCVLDQNCQKVVRWALDGTYDRTIESEELFGARPATLSAAVRDHDGVVWIAAAHKDGEVCEGAIYRVPADVWAR
ncbi:MAG: hypothetical protein KC464_04220, partial [Myxococcales bacterium]|nr:hypothetical protein [Myxococcales bacterium]